MRHCLILLMLLCTISISAQDVIVKKNGSTILCRIVEVNSSEVVYKKWSNLNGANYVMERADITAINYESGKKDLLSEPGINQYTPGNQNTGLQQMNDNALLRMDYNARNIPNKVKKQKKTAWIGGGILAGAGIALICIISEDEEKAKTWVPVGIGSIVAGGVWTGAFLYSAKRYQKIADSMVSSSPIWQNEIKLRKGNSLIAGIDLLKEQLHQNKTIGVALRCKF